MINQVTIPEAIHSKDPVGGYTHDFYRYPARFSPQFARAMIEQFTVPGETVYDPFMGGATSLVEATMLGRAAIGTDISSLAVFISTVKTTPLAAGNLDRLRRWTNSLEKRLNLRSTRIRKSRETNCYYQRNIDGKSTWPIRKIIELALREIEELPESLERQFARCALLRTSQWALDCRKDVPGVDHVRTQLIEHLTQMITGAQAFARAVRDAARRLRMDHLPARCLHRSAMGIEADPEFKAIKPPALVLTSPPYPGVHVLYHRWQVLGRKETPAAFWIAGRKDGHGSAFYTFGDRGEPGLASYYQNLWETFQSISAVCGPKTVIAQMVAFSEPRWQLPRYLQVLNRASLVEIKFREWSNNPDGRIWREVPNRKWYADQRGPTCSSKEVVLFHALKPR